MTLYCHFISSESLNLINADVLLLRLFKEHFQRCCFTRTTQRSDISFIFFGDLWLALHPVCLHQLAVSENHCA